MMILFLAFLIARKVELLTLHWILSNFLGSFILVIIILFKSEIRRVLAQVGRSPFVKTSEEILETIEEVIKAAVYLSSRKTGALMVLERQTGLNDYLRNATILDAKVSWELLVSIFYTQSPLHDGAVLIQNNRLKAAGCYLPLTRSTRVSRSYGSRHRAALGLSEETDAALVVVSEETGRISVALNGRFTRDLDSAHLKRVLQTLFVQEKGQRAYWLFGPRKPGRSKGKKA
jgi:diadenylate cyclase